MNELNFCIYFFCFMNKYDSRSLKCLFLSTLPIASFRVCWGVCNCRIFPREYDKFASVLLTCVFFMWASHILWALRPKSMKLSNWNSVFRIWNVYPKFFETLFKYTCPVWLSHFFNWIADKNLTWHQSRCHGAFGGLNPPNNAPSPPHWNMKHCKSVEVCQFLQCQDPLLKTFWQRLCMARQQNNKTWSAREQ